MPGGRGPCRFEPARRARAGGGRGGSRARARRGRDVLAVRGGVGARRGRPVAGAVARSGVDALLVALALLGYLQLRAHRPGLDAPDPVLVLAPVLCLVAAAAVALRLLPLVVRAAEVAARRGRGLVVPLAGWHLARGRATAGVFLTALAAASATFALSVQATWALSQHDQAAAGLGADVVVEADGPPGQGERLVDAVAAADPSATVTVAPVTRRTIGLGSRPGGGTLVGVDTTRPDDLRGRPPGGSRMVAGHGRAGTRSPRRHAGGPRCVDPGRGDRGPHRSDGRAVVAGGAPDPGAPGDSGSASRSRDPRSPSTGRRTR